MTRLKSPAEAGELSQDNPGQRLDKWLWCARFFKSRSLATKLCQGHKVRVNSVIIRKASALVRPGDVLTFPQGRDIRVVKILGLAARRGPAPEARLLYEDLSPPAPSRQERQETVTPGAQRVGRPTKKDRRVTDRLLGKD